MTAKQSMVVVDSFRLLDKDSARSCKFCVAAAGRVSDSALDPERMCKKMKNELADLLHSKRYE